MAYMFMTIASVLSMISFVYLFIFVNKDGKGKRAAVKRFLYDGIPNAFKSCLRMTCGERAVWALERFTKYLCFEANPLI